MLGEAALDEALVILVVEDDQTIQSIVEEALSDGGFEPAIASSGEEALTLLGGSKYRVLVIDIKRSAFPCSAKWRSSHDCCAASRWIWWPDK